MDKKYQVSSNPQEHGPLSSDDVSIALGYRRDALGTAISIVLRVRAYHEWMHDTDPDKNTEELVDVPIELLPVKPDPVKQRANG